MRVDWRIAAPLLRPGAARFASAPGTACYRRVAPTADFTTEVAIPPTPSPPPTAAIVLTSDRGFVAGEREGTADRRRLAIRVYSVTVEGNSRQSSVGRVTVAVSSAVRVASPSRIQGARRQRPSRHGLSTGATGPTDSDSRTMRRRRLIDCRLQIRLLANASSELPSGMLTTLRAAPSTASSAESAVLTGAEGTVISAVDS